MSQPILTYQLLPDPGALTKVSLSALTLDEATRQLPAGAYTTFRTFGRTRVLRLEEHFARLEETARLAGREPAIDRARIRSALRQVIAESEHPELRCRVILDLSVATGTLYLLAESLRVPTEGDYQRGVRAVTRWLHRDNPKAKLTGFIESSAAVRRQLPIGVNEALMVGEDSRVLEGLSSNFFAVLDGMVWTAEEGVLSGITRSVVLDLIRMDGSPLKLEGIPVDRLSEVREAFITSASRAVLPVTVIDGRPVGSGVPEKTTRRLMAAYSARIESELTEL